jgi:hypothetical protein
METHINGEPIIKLPQKIIQLIKIKLTPEDPAYKEMIMHTSLKQEHAYKCICHGINKIS